MKTASARVIQQLDRIAIEELGIKSVLLMENAGRAVAKVIIDILRHKRNRPSPAGNHYDKITGRVNIICGKGNNAGDGFVCARYLIDKKINTKIFMIGGSNRLKPDALSNYNILKERQGIIEISNLSEFKRQEDVFVACDLFVDAIFGLGLEGEPREPFSSIIRFMNNTTIPIISVDIPSGLNATSGIAYSACIKAFKTVTFSLAKTGFFINEGPSYCGQIIVEDIGIPKELIDKYVK
jgi:NAD(P)H-hydrate epimerase